MGYFYCLNKERKTDASPEASVKASLEKERAPPETQSNVSSHPHWIKQGETHPL